MMHSNSRSVACFIVEGNIGAGKSTFLRLVDEQLPLQIVPEPLARWQHVGAGHNMLDMFYKDPHRWTLSFELYAFMTRVTQHEIYDQAGNGGVQLLERSVFSDRYCFAKNAYELGFMNKLEWEVYQELYKWLLRTVRKPDGFIYLRAAPETCHARIAKRNRSEEAGVPFEYFKKLHEKHEKWLVERCDAQDGLGSVPVLILDCDAEFERDRDMQHAHIKAVRDFVADNNCLQKADISISVLVKKEKSALEYE